MFIMFGIAKPLHNAMPLQWQCNDSNSRADSMMIRDALSPWVKSLEDSMMICDTVSQIRKPGGRRLMDRDTRVKVGGL